MFASQQKFVHLEKQLLKKSRWERVCFIEKFIEPFLLKNGTTKYNDVFGKCIYRSTDTTMCTYMVNFIKKLKNGMYIREVMNTILEPLGVLQVSWHRFRNSSVNLSMFCRQLYRKIQMSYSYVLHIFSKLTNHH